ncbi:MAG: phosphate regulon sensor histidine kinase PhoR [Gammaproteobacteria bacterium]|uniref:phosphate regulon sensor histidine kinase PhoR n=1 Tax=Rhodoferax sp. TaxID=50421 RepID=UPI0017C6EF86|nr:phosphate regulon sensor histidine kinase PhoR [Rhodoferax sp.]MBU3900435.1 phosphate regulon sensor histidine kinase PhoR [Gammaproteobacteria bacterium]MBA3059388.1 phosphate regulon sensor histidine kinase PhoR [Rhodoferax sp.]MBU3997402.1 phosphate regulon sensor histidine kinase PhoR [Gammaproteobacteria bacterium]MBU4082323.1 phosphate regulon sensor histidine kinase PhoR [Gammaproteobacteria bacterium]MBU4112872.1 phosphate regulon sensor histidine kinase PhoR [Gammaproteobacteria ba
MFLRFFSFTLSQLLGGLAGWFVMSITYVPITDLAGVLAGVVLGGVTWFLLDATRGVRLLRWLRVGDAAEVAMRTGLWGEVSDRARRVIRARERETQESQHRLQDFLSALQASPNGVLLLDANGQIEWLNQTAAAHFGLDAQRDLMQHLGNLVRDPGFASYFAQRDFRHALIMPGRESTAARPVKLSVQLHPYGNGRLLLLSSDITAVEQAEAMRRDFVANVSHEIRTPLTVLAGFVETLQTLPLNDEERQRYLTLMAQQADRMQSLVNDLLVLSRLEGRPLPSDAEAIAVPALMRQLEQDGRALSAVMNPGAEPRHQLRFESLLSGDIVGAPSELLSAMGNLVSNAIRYTPPAGSIVVRARLLADDRAEFSVSDTGPGIAPEHLPRLTERFYRVDRSRSRDTGGTGLGLAIVKHVAQRHGGELIIDSTPGKGSVFKIIFPASRVRLPKEAPASLPAAPAASAPDLASSRWSQTTES